LKGLKLIRKNNIDLIYVSCKPFSTALAGVMLKKSTKKPLILDFRDPVSFPPYLFNDNFVGRYRRKVIKKLEKFVLERTNRLLTTTEETKNAYIEIYPFLKDKIQRIYNGYYLPKNDGYTARNHEKFIIGYMGNFYYDLIPSDNFFKALKKIISEKMIPANMIEFLYVGSLRKKNWLDKVSKSYNLKNNIRSIGYIQRTETQKVLMQCALLLLRIAPPMISTKLFEGLRDGIPLLAVIEPGEVEKLIKEYSSNSYIITSNRIEDIVKAIMDAFDRWKNNDLKWSTNNDYLTKFCKQALTNEFIAGIDAIHQMTQEEIYKKIKVIHSQ
jgi:glycosyltransferase involved in cell wall biosynthesis